MDDEKRYVECAEHGPQQATYVCRYLVESLRTGKKVGFWWADDPDNPRPDACGLDDRQVLERTAREGRVLVTHDRKTMPRHFSEFITKESSPDLLVVPPYLSVAAAVENLILIWSAPEAEEWVNRIGFLPL